MVPEIRRITFNHRITLWRIHHRICTTNYSAANYSTANYSTANYSTANYSTANYSAANYRTANYSTGNYRRGNDYRRVRNFRISLRIRRKHRIPFRRNNIPLWRNNIPLRRNGSFATLITSLKSSLKHKDIPGIEAYEYSHMIQNARK